MKRLLLSLVIIFASVCSTIGAETPKEALYPNPDVRISMDDPYVTDSDKYKDTYPQTFPEFTGQVIGGCMSLLHTLEIFPGLSKEEVERRLSLDVILSCATAMGETVICLGTYAGWSSGQSLLYFLPAGIVPALFICPQLAKCGYNYAKDSGRTELTERANFAIHCLPEDPLSVPHCCISCQTSLKYGCIGCANILYPPAQCVKKNLCVPTKNCLVSAMNTLEDTVWSYFLKDCLNAMCGPGEDERSHEI